MSKKLLCPNCEKERLVEPIRENRTVEVKGEKFNVEVALWRCLECKEEFEDRQNPSDELDLAYREYRAAHKMLQPEEIRNMREDLGLTQAELAALLGWSPATISRYENGALQEVSHDNFLQSLHEPINLKAILDRSTHHLSQERHKELNINLLEKMEKRYPQYIYKTFELRDPDIFSGYAQFSFDKYCAVIYRLLSNSSDKAAYKTKLNKLLFYSDFLSFGKRKKSITGSCYINEYYGPCPKDFQSLLGVMADHGLVAIELKDLNMEGNEAELIKLTDYIAPDVLDETEKKIVDRVWERLGSWTSKRLTKFSHMEKAYKHTNHKDKISYDFARYLQIK